jgi:outer membrane receptor protein involved in Fe transport
MFVDGDTTTASRFNNARYQNDLVGASYSQAQALVANPSLNPYAYAKLSGFFSLPANPAQALAGLSQSQLVSQYGKATGVAAYYADSGNRVSDSTLLDFLTPFVAKSQAESTSTDLQLSKSFQLAGKHHLTLGGYATNYGVNQDFEQSLLVSTIEPQSKLVNLRGTDASGNPVGPSLTLDGAILPGFGGYISNISVRGHALYVLDHWDTLDNRLKLDIGLRRQDQQANVVRYDRNQITNVTPASVTPGSDGSSTALDEIFLASSTPRNLNTKLAATGWSIGANYSLKPNLAVYALTSKSFRLPSMQDLNEFLVAPTIPGSKIETIMQYEGGLRYYADTWDTQIAVFANRFSPRSQLVSYQDFTSPQCAVPGGIPQINSCPTVNEFYRIGIQNIGTEIEATWHPRAVTGLELKFGGVLQNPKVVGADYTTVKTDSTNGVVTGYEFQKIGENGRRPRRLANQMVNLQTTYDTKSLTGLPFKPYLKYTYFGSRYSEATDQNVTLYPAYYHLDGGFIWDFDKNTAFQLHVSNITNQLSFTEGDPIDPSLKGPNGATNRGVGRPLFGRIVRASLTYFF